MKLNIKRNFKKSIQLNSLNKSSSLSRKASQDSFNFDLDKLGSVVMTEEHKDPETFDRKDQEAIAFLLNSIKVEFEAKVKVHESKRKSLKQQLGDETKQINFIEKENRELKEKLAKLICLCSASTDLDKNVLLQLTKDNQRLRTGKETKNLKPNRLLFYSLKKPAKVESHSKSRNNSVVEEEANLKNTEKEVKSSNLSKRLMNLAKGTEVKRPKIEIRKRFLHKRLITD